MASKILVNGLRVALHNNKLRSFQEIERFGRFDRICHRKLKKLGQILLAHGRYIKRKGLIRWYLTGLKPKATVELNTEIVDRVYEKRLKARAIRALSKHRRDQHAFYHLQMNAVAGIVRFIRRSNKIKLGRCLLIWRAALRQGDSRIRKLARLLNRHESRMKR